MKKVISVILVVFVLALSSLALYSCGNKKPTIGIIQFGSHASLNNCYDGVIAGLEESGIKLDDYNIELVNSNFDSQLSQTQANSFVNSKAKVIIAIATPSAVAAATASDGEIPVVYCAITGVMGKSDLKIGVLFSTEESSSPIQVANLKKAAEKYDGMEILDSAVADINTIDAKVNELISRGVDCFVNLLDNTVVGKLETNILPITNEKKIPVFGSEIEQVKVGCAASASIEYIDVGRAAGKAAAEILNGKSASDIPVATITDPKNYYNSKVCETLGLKVPENLSATDVAK